MRIPWKSRSLLTVLLIAPIALAAASGANAQTVIGPGPIAGTVVVVPENSPVNVVGNTEIVAPGGDAIDVFGGNLIVDTESVTSKGPISITSGVAGVFNEFGLATINITSGPSDPVTIMSAGPALRLQDASTSLTANANGGNLTFHSTGSSGVVAQFGATINLTGATIISDGGVDAVLIGGNSTDIGSQATLTDVNIFATGALIGLDATRMAPSWGCRVAASR